MFKKLSVIALLSIFIALGFSSVAIAAYDERVWAGNDGWSDTGFDLGTVMAGDVLTMPIWMYFETDDPVAVGLMSNNTKIVISGPGDFMPIDYAQGSLWDDSWVKESGPGFMRIGTYTKDEGMLSTDGSKTAYFVGDATFTAPSETGIYTIDLMDSDEFRDGDFLDWALMFQLDDYHADDPQHSLYVTFESGIVTVTAVPIPGALFLLGSGLLGIVGIRRNTKRA